MASKKITAMPDLAGAQVPTDLTTLVDLSQPASTQNVKSTLNDVFAEITKNITDLTVQFGDGVAGTVSAASKGKLRYNNTAGSFQVSENGGAYQNLLKGSGVATRVAFWSATDELTSNSDFYWDNVNERLGIGVGSTPDGPLDVLADGTALAQQWRQNGGAMRVQMIMDSVPEASLGTTTNHTFHLLTNNLQRLTVENGGLIGINKASVIQAQLQVVSKDATTETLILNSAASPSANIAEFYNDSSLRFAFSPAGNLGIGLSGAGGATGSITFNGVTSGAVTVSVASVAGTWTLTLPTTEGNAGQFLQTDGNGVTTWATATTSPASPVNSVQFNNAGAFGGSSNLLWNNTNNRLSVGVGASPDAPIDVLAESLSAIAQQWRPNTGTMRAAIKLDGGPETFFGTTTPHNFHLITNNIQRLSIENTSGNVGINKAAAIAAQLQVVASSTTTVPLILNSSPSTLANLAEFYNDTALRFTFGNTGILTLGATGTPGATGQLTFCVAGQARTQTLRGGTAPAATNTFTWPNADPTAGQALTASAPSGGVVTLSWTTISASPASPANSVQYNNAGNFGGNSGFLYTPGSTTGNELALASSTITSGNLFSIALTGTGAASNTRTALNVSTSGANATAGQTTFGAQFSNTSTGSSTNIAILVSASGGSTNAAIQATNGRVRVGSDLDAVNYNAYTSPANALSTSVSNRSALFGSDVLGFKMASTYIVGWSSNAPGAGDAIASTDTSLSRAAASVLRIANGTTGAGALLVAPSTATVTGNFTVLPDNAATNSLVTVARIGVNSTGTAADGFGASLSWSAETSTTNDTETGRNNCFWTTATHASRTAAFSWSLTSNASLAEFMRLAVPALTSPMCLSVHEATAPNVWTAGSYAAKLYLISSSLPAVGVAAHFSATGADAPQWQMLRGRGTNASPTAVQASDSLGNLEWWGQTSTSTNNVVAGARIRVSATENWSAGNNGCQMIFFVSNNAGTITERMSLNQTGTLRVGATAGSTSTDNKIQVGNYSSWNADAAVAIYTGANDDKGLEIIGTNAQTANLFRVYLDAGADLFNVRASGVFVARTFTVATLPSAATSGVGARAFVTDALAPTVLTAVTGGGAVKVPVYSDGSTWLVG